MKRIAYSITGIVQGVGFRPFINNLANSININGVVFNDSNGVQIEAEGDEYKLSEFEKRIKSELPSRASIFTFSSKELPIKGYNSFKIIQSSVLNNKLTPISPDISICEDCKRELLDPNNRRFNYPFINCTNCGPRYTIINEVPYDRINTSMSKFIMCPECQDEYDNPNDRRFHAQPNSCEKCGPSLSLYDAQLNLIKQADNNISNYEIIMDTVKHIQAGAIVGIKGLGGYHFACLADDDNIVKTLRQRKRREFKPFAIMFPDLKLVEDFCVVSTKEREILQSPEAPIVLLKIKPGISPFQSAILNSNTIGVMIPYTPLHLIILNEIKQSLIMTSGNISSEPIVFDDKDLNKLKGIADYFLVYNREIKIYCDDPIVRVFKDSEMVIRRSRGYAPFPINLNREIKKNILAVGAELKNTIAFTRKNLCYLSQYIGDLENIESYESFKFSISHLQNLLGIKPEIIAMDLHPDYVSTKYAKSLDCVKKYEIQHHQAHIASCMAEYGVFGQKDGIGVALDGTGYGLDGKIWGGEFFVVKGANFKRAGRFDYLPVCGGENAIKKNWLTAVTFLSTLGFTREEIKKIVKIECINEGEEYFDNFYEIAKAERNAYFTSSVGRIFDAVSAILGACFYNDYEGQAPCELEYLANKVKGHSGLLSSGLDFEIICKGGEFVIETKTILKDLVSKLIEGYDKADLALAFHSVLGRAVVKVIELINSREKIGDIFLSGGVFQNITLLEMIVEQLIGKGYNVFWNKKVPSNDGGIALGQAVIAANLSNNERIE